MLILNITQEDKVKNREKYEEMVVSWVNGNNSWVYDQYIDLEPGQKEEFVEYAKKAHTDQDHYDPMNLLTYLLIKQA